MERVHLVISGDVQGVGYRAWALGETKRLGLTGWVKNRDDGAVEIIAEGEEKFLKEFIKECQKGPDVAWVENVKTTWGNATEEFVAFQVIY